MKTNEGKRVLIVNQHTSNLGDEAAGCALVMKLLQSARITRIDILYNGGGTIPVLDSRVHHDVDVTFKWVNPVSLALYFLFRKAFYRPKSGTLKKWVGLIRDADCVYVAPGGANIGIYRDWRFLLRLLMVVYEGKVPIFHFNTVGASRNVVFDGIAMYVLRRSRVFVREECSRLYLEGKGVSSVLGPDTAFLLPSKICAIRDDVVSFVPTRLDNWHPSFRGNPVDALVIRRILPDLARVCRERSLSIEILPHEMTDSERAFQQGIRAELIRLGMEEKSVKLRSDICDYEGYDAAIASSRAVLGMRYHAIVLAAKNHRPFFSLSYENKMEEVCRYTGMDRYTLALASLGAASGAEFAVKLEEILDHGAEISARLRAAVQSQVLNRLYAPTEETLGGEGREAAITQAEDVRPRMD